MYKCKTSGYTQMYIRSFSMTYKDWTILSHSAGVPFFLKVFSYIRLLEADIASLVRCVNLAIWTGETPNFSNIQILSSWLVTSQKLFRFLPNPSYTSLSNPWISFHCSSDNLKELSFISLKTSWYIAEFFIFSCSVFILS